MLVHDREGVESPEVAKEVVADLQVVDQAYIVASAVSIVITVYILQDHDDPVYEIKPLKHYESNEH